MSEAAPPPPNDAYDHTLLSHMHPADWVNPEPAPRYNLVILGAGAAGLAAARGAAALGASVALVERCLIGGRRLHFGCARSVMMLRAAWCAAEVRDASEFAVEVPPGRRVDFAGVLERMRRARIRLAQNDSAAALRELGIDVMLGEGRFWDPQTVVVAGKTLRFNKALIATGAHSTEPPVAGLAEAGFLTQETLLNLKALPRRLAVIGAGSRGCELAQAFARFGAQVFLLEAGPRILPREDADAAERLQQSLARDGVAVMAACNVLRVEKLSAGKAILVESAGSRQELLVDEIVVAVGRAASVEGLNLDAAGVAFDPRTGIAADDRLRTTNCRIFAAGDVCARSIDDRASDDRLATLLHWRRRVPRGHPALPGRGEMASSIEAADAMARLAIRNALCFGRAKLSALRIPRCIYTSPEIAQVGLHEDEARERGILVTPFMQELSDVDRTVLDEQTAGFVKIHLRSGSDQIVGATVVAEHASEMISELTLAMVGRLGLTALAQVIHPYPTQADAIRKIADSYVRTRPRPTIKRLLESWLRFSRR